jgi:hypothetical protein
MHSIKIVQVSLKLEVTFQFNPKHNKKVARKKGKRKTYGLDDTVSEVKSI